jgi:glutamate/tyrosine decarboxylase-like PLP-dependent enzyme
MRPANSAQKVIAMHENTPSLLASVQQHAAAWFASLGSRQVRATLTADQLRQRLGGPLPIDGTDPEAITDLLAAAGMHGTVASAGPRYFGFVVGGSLPAALAADWLVSAWDQNSGIYVLSPLVSVIEQIAGSWLRDLAGLPETMSYGFVTGCQMANFTSLAAARHRVLARAGWDVAHPSRHERRGALHHLHGLASARSRCQSSSQDLDR